MGNSSLSAFAYGTGGVIGIYIWAISLTFFPPLPAVLIILGLH